MSCFDIMLSFIVTYLHIVKGYSVKSIIEFTIYDFINVGKVGEYKSWFLTDFEMQLLDNFYRYVRVNWAKSSKNDKISAIVTSPCGHFSTSKKFFIDSAGRECVVDMFKDMQFIANALQNNDLARALASCLSPRTTATTTARPARASRARILSVGRLRNSLEIRTHVYEKCLLQQWSDVDVKETCDGGRGRGLVASKNFFKNEIICDYHARMVSQEEMEEIAVTERVNYMFCGPNGLFWDGSAESCSCHPNSRLLGRLVNFAAQGTLECNVKPHFFQFKPLKPAQVFHAIIFVATRDIALSEELRYDYGDKTCLELFQ
jgi:hypothetical protein